MSCGARRRGLVVCAVARRRCLTLAHVHRTGSEITDAGLQAVASCCSKLTSFRAEWVTRVLRLPCGVVVTVCRAVGWGTCALALPSTDTANKSPTAGSRPLRTAAPT